MLWLLGTICVLLALILVVAIWIDMTLMKILDREEAISIQIDQVVQETTSARYLLAKSNEDSQELLKRSKPLEHLKAIPEILRHLMALRELTYGRKQTEHDWFDQWPAVSPREEFEKRYGKKRSATSKGEPGQPSDDESEP